MTRREVQKAMKRGLGRGILAVRENPDRYRDLVLWACGRNLAFDTQCEGTRVWYIYQLLSYYPDRETFRDPVIQKLRKATPRVGWNMQYYSELLAFFAEDGDQTAEDALWDKYAELLRKLKKHRGNGWSKNNTVFCFSLICLALSRDNAAYCKIAQDIGNLFLSGQCDVDDFEWLYESRPRGMNAFLKRKAPSSEELSAFLTAFDDLERERASSAADQQERLFAADQQERLFAEDSPADDLESVLFKTIENYQPEDESFLRNALLGLQIDYAERTHWHGLHMEVLDLFDSKSGVRKPPKTLLPIIYESTLCSCCREFALYYMGKHRMISDPMWEEMLYDSNEDIRTMARQHFRRLEKRRS